MSIVANILLTGELLERPVLAYAYIYIYIYIYIHMKIYTHEYYIICTYQVHMCILMCIDIYIYVYTQIYVYVCLYADLFVRFFVCLSFHVLFHSLFFRLSVCLISFCVCVCGGGVWGVGNAVTQWFWRWTGAAWNFGKGEFLGGFGW